MKERRLCHRPIIVNDFSNRIKSLPLFLALLNVLTSFFVYSSVNIYYTVETNEWFIIPLPDPGGSWLHLFKTACKSRFSLISKKSLVYDNYF